MRSLKVRASATAAMSFLFLVEPVLSRAVSGSKVFKLLGMTQPLGMSHEAAVLPP